MPRLDRPPPGLVTRLWRDRVHSCEAAHRCRAVRSRAGWHVGNAPPPSGRSRQSAPYTLRPCERGMSQPPCHGRIVSPRVRRSNSQRAGTTGSGLPAAPVTPLAGTRRTVADRVAPPRGRLRLDPWAIGAGCAAQRLLGPFVGRRLRARLPGGSGFGRPILPIAPTPARRPVVAIILPDGPDFQPRRSVRCILRQQSCPNHLSEIARRTPLPQDVCSSPCPIPAPRPAKSGLPRGKLRG